jgi:class 3 adenylate cyclase
MAELPTGTVTLLFSDIEGSTRLLARLGDRYVAVLAEHQRLLRAAFARFNGREVGTEGDGFFVAFDKASEAAAAVTAWPWPPPANRPADRSEGVGACRRQAEPAPTHYPQEGVPGWAATPP